MKFGNFVAIDKGALEMGFNTLSRGSVTQVEIGEEMRASCRDMEDVVETSISPIVVPKGDVEELLSYVEGLSVDPFTASSPGLGVAVVFGKRVIHALDLVSSIAEFTDKPVLKRSGEVGVFRISDVCKMLVVNNDHWAIRIKMDLGAIGMDVVYASNHERRTRMSCEIDEKGIRVDVKVRQTRALSVYLAYFEQDKEPSHGND